MSLAFQCVLSLQKVHYALPRSVIWLYFLKRYYYGDGDAGDDDDNNNNNKKLNKFEITIQTRVRIKTKKWTNAFT